MGKKPGSDDFGNPTTPVISRIPLEDMRELWVWGSWKERTPRGFSKHVFVVCTSRAACRRYAGERTSDTWLLADEFGEEAAKRPPVPEDDSLFDANNNGDSLGGRQFRLLTFKQLVKEVRVEAEAAEIHGGVTLLVNPRKGSDRIEADAMYSAADFVRALKLQARGFGTRAPGK